MTFCNEVRNAINNKMILHPEGFLKLRKPPENEFSGGLFV
jgi:hypothetical protein